MKLFNIKATHVGHSKLNVSRVCIHCFNWRIVGSLCNQYVEKEIKKHWAVRCTSLFFHRCGYIISPLKLTTVGKMFCIKMYCFGNFYKCAKLNAQRTLHCHKVPNIVVDYKIGHNDHHTKVLENSEIKMFETDWCLTAEEAWAVVVELDGNERYKLTVQEGDCNQQYFPEN